MADMAIAPAQYTIASLNSCKATIEHSINEIREHIANPTEYMSNYAKVKNQIEFLALDLLQASDIIYNLRIVPAPPLIKKQVEDFDVFITSVRYTLKLLIDLHRTV